MFFDEINFNLFVDIIVGDDSCFLLILVRDISIKGKRGFKIKKFS